MKKFKQNFGRGDNIRFYGNIYKKENTTLLHIKGELPFLMPQVLAIFLIVGILSFVFFVYYLFLFDFRIGNLLAFVFGLIFNLFARFFLFYQSGDLNEDLRNILEDNSISSPRKED